jgi:hypothetical protein
MHGGMRKLVLSIAIAASVNVLVGRPQVFVDGDSLVRVSGTGILKNWGGVQS